MNDQNTPPLTLIDPPPAQSHELKGVPRRQHTVTRKAAQALCMSFEHACTVVAAPGEDPDKVARFKYAAGRNLDALHRIHFQSLDLERKGGPVPAAPPELDEFRNKLLTLMYAMSQRDDAGNVVQHGEPPEPVIAAEKREEYIKGHDELAAQYPTVTAWREARDAARAAYLESLGDELVTFNVYLFPFANIPQLLSGAYMSDIRFMLVGAPDNETETITSVEPVAAVAPTENVAQK